MAALIAALVLSIAPVAASSQPPALAFDAGDGPFGFCCTHPVSTTLTVVNEGGRASGNLTVTLALDVGTALAITEDNCTGKSLGPGRDCSIEITWLAGGDTDGTLTIAGSRASVSAHVFGYAVP
jgi:hypothetical protein